MNNIINKESASSKYEDSSSQMTDEVDTSASSAVSHNGEARTGPVLAKKVQFKYSPEEWPIERLKQAIRTPQGKLPALTSLCRGILVSISERTIYLFAYKQIGHRVLKEFPFYTPTAESLKLWHAGNKRSFKLCQETVKDTEVLFESNENDADPTFKSPLQTKQAKKAEVKHQRAIFQNENAQNKEIETVNKANEQEIIREIYQRMGKGVSLKELYKEYTASGDVEILNAMGRHFESLKRHDEICREVLAVKDNVASQKIIRPLIFGKGEEKKYQEYINNLPDIKDYKELAYSFGDRNLMAIHLKNNINFYALYKYMNEPGMTLQRLKKKLCDQLKEEDSSKLSAYKMFLAQCEARIKSVLGEK